MTEDLVLPGHFFTTDGVARSPICCEQKMEDAGECSEGCCDYFKCKICGKRIRLEHS